MRQLATFVLDGARYGIDVLRVQEALRPQERTPVPLAPAGTAGLVNLRGQVVLTFDLRTRLGLAPLTDDAEPMMLVVRIGDEPVSLLVDEIGDVVHVEDDLLAPPPETLDPSLRDIVVGAYTLPEGLLLALDVERALAS